jgi:hypothetical protein
MPSTLDETSTLTTDAAPQTSSEVKQAPASSSSDAKQASSTPQSTEPNVVEMSDDDARRVWAESIKQDTGSYPEGYDPDAPKGEAKPAAKDETVKAKPEAAKQGDEPADEDDTSGLSAEDKRTELIKAKMALRRDGWKDTTLSKLSREEIIELGLKRAKGQDFTDNLVKSTKTNKDTPAKGDTTQAANSSTGRSGAEPTATGTGDGNPILPPELVSLIETEMLDPDAQNTLRTGLQKVVSTQVAQAIAALQPKIQQLEMEASRAALTRIQTISRDLAGDIPMLAQPANIEHLIEKLAQIDPEGHALRGDDEMLKAALEEAAFAKWGRQLTKNAAVAYANKARKNVTGLPETPRSPTKTAFTEEDRLKQLWEIAVAAGDNKAKFDLHRAQVGI